MGRKLIWLVFVWVAAAAFVVPVRSQERSDEVIKVSTTLVSVPVIVSDRQGRYIPDLTQSDFNIVQDGVEQKIDFFAAAEEPINLALLIDTSQSTRSVMGDIRSAAKKMVRLLNADDRGMIVSFDYTTHVLSPLTSDKKQLEKAIGEAKAPKDFGTTLRDALDETVRKQFAGVNGRKAIILLTDGKDHGSFISTQTLLNSLEESDVIIYTVFFDGEEFQARIPPQFGDRDVFGGRRGGVFGGGFPGDRYPRRDNRRDNPRRRERRERQNENAMDFLRRLSDATAGRFYESEKSKFKQIFALIVDELRHQYRLGYYPPEDAEAGRTHSLKVKVSRPDVVVRARSIYRPQTK